MQATGNQRETYNRAATAAADLYRLTGRSFYLSLFFNITERAKSVVLLERLSMQTEKGGKYQRLYDLDVKLRKEIAAYENHHSTQKPDNDARKNAVKRHLFRLYELQEWFYEELKDKFPQYYATWVKPDFVGIGDVQKKLRGDECLITYFYTDTVLYTLLVNQDTTVLLSRAVQPTFLATVAGLCNDLKIQNSSCFGSDVYSSFVHRSDSLYKVLVGPVDEYLENRSIIIASDGLLHYLPFEVLISCKPAKPGVRYHQLSYLLNKHAVSYTGSASLFCHLREGHETGGVSFFAPSYVLCRDEACGVIRKYGLTELESKDEEAAILKEEMEATLYIGNEANESAFKEIAARSGIIHLTLHGIVNEDNPEQSMLVFGNGGSSDDGLMYAWEIYNLNLNAGMVVLGACHSGSGRIRTGEGTISIARAFLYAGCQSVITTRWAVNDKSSNRIFASFYKNLNNGDNKAIALQKAKTEYIRSVPSYKAHPGYWAGLMVMGDTVPLESAADTLLYGLLLVPVLAVLLWLAFRKNKKKQTC